MELTGPGAGPHDCSAVGRERPTGVSEGCLMRPGRYDWEARRDRYSRRLKGVLREPEDRDGILAFFDTHRGVEAYMEPRTVAHPLSVVLVADDGEYRRFELADDEYIRLLAKTRSLP